MDAQTAVARFVNKTVPFRFLGRDLVFQLSHALFSSFDIDDGTRALLKSIAQNVDVPALGSVLDVGCGVGVIGACLRAHAPRAKTVLQDRDALAAAFADAHDAALADALADAHAAAPADAPTAHHVNGAGENVSYSILISFFTVQSSSKSFAGQNTATASGSRIRKIT